MTYFILSKPTGTLAESRLPFCTCSLPARFPPFLKGFFTLGVSTWAQSSLRHRVPLNKLPWDLEQP